MTFCPPPIGLRPRYKPHRVSARSHLRGRSFRLLGAGSRRETVDLDMRTVGSLDRPNFGIV